jgi:hypothetical protein
VVLGLKKLYLSSGILMADFELKLSARGLGNIAAGKAENDFTFNVGDIEYEFPWFIADFLSKSRSTACN